MRSKPTTFGLALSLRKPFLWAALLLLGLGVAGTLLHRPVRLENAVAAALDDQALAAPEPTPIAQPVSVSYPVPRYVWVREVVQPTPRPIVNQLPMVTLVVGSVTIGQPSLQRETAETVCTGDRVALNAQGSDPNGDTLLYDWTVTGGRVVGEGSLVAFDTTGLAPGEYKITIRVDDGCGGSALATKALRVSNCAPLLLCFAPALEAVSSASNINAGETVTLSTPGVTGGRDFGTASYEWKTSAGKLSGSGLSVRLDTAEVAPGTLIEVTVNATSTTGGCTASGTTRVTVANESFVDVEAVAKMHGPHPSGETQEAPEVGDNAALIVPTPQTFAPKCARMSAAMPGLVRPKMRRILAPPSPEVKVSPTPNPTPTPLSQYREKVTASYPAYLEVDAPAQVTVRFTSEYKPIEPTPTATVSVNGSTANATLYPAPLPGRRAEVPIAAEMGEQYTAWIRAELTQAQEVGVDIAPQSVEWQELKRGKDETLNWDWAVKARLPVIEAVLVAKLEIEWRTAGQPPVRKVLVPRFELKTGVADPLLNQQEIKRTTQVCYYSSVGLFGVGILPLPRKRREDGEEEESDQPLVTPVQVGPEARANESADQVECSVFAPPTARRDDVLFVQVFAHLHEQAAEAATQAKQFDSDTQQRGVKTLSANIARGAKLMFDLQMKGLEVTDPVQELVWLGRPESVQFVVNVPSDCRSGNVAGKVTVSYDSVPVGHITFILKIVETAIAAAPITVATPAPLPANQLVGTDARGYRLIFISYASKDRDQVLRRVQMLDNLGLHYFQDVLNLDPGDRWEKKLYENIDKSDLFLLFWSESAKQSSWVLKEVEYALALQQKNNNLPEIKPVIIEGPPVIPPPATLADLHFNDRLIYFMDRTKPAQS